MMWDSLIVVFIGITFVTAGVENDSQKRRNASWGPQDHKRIKRQWTFVNVPPKSCTAPDSPEHGSFRHNLIISSEGAVVTDIYPGKRGTDFFLGVECVSGYALKEDYRVNCVDGKWDKELPKCLRYCRVPSDESIQFNCVDDDQTTRPCNSIEFVGTKVQPKCLLPNYSGTVSEMNCLPNGKWDLVEHCTAGFCDMPLDVPGDVSYTCVRYENSTEVQIPCTSRVTPGTTVKPRCANRNKFSADMHCLAGGEWNYIAECSTVFCELPPDDEVEFNCVTYENSVQITRPCRHRVFPGVPVQPRCRGKNSTKLSNMRCLTPGVWNYEPKCAEVKTACQLSPHHSVDYSCVTQDGTTTSSRPCGAKEFPGTTVVPTCREPNYHGIVSHMHCQPDGEWDYVATCSPECGRTTPDGKTNVINGTRAKHGQLPWHAGIYRKTSTPYSQICGGSLVSTTAVISAAHCFWSELEGLRPADLFAVALGKIYRPWSDTHDEDAKHYNVSKIHVPSHYRGSSTNYQNDIALVLLDREVEYHTYIRPVCLDFDFSFNSRQLQAGKSGKVAGWGLTESDGHFAPVLQVVDLPFVPFGQCFDESPMDFQEFITSDKFCAGYLNGTALCEGDSGGGLVFPEQEKGITRYYLRGVVSTAPRATGRCDPNVRTTFTELINHERFIKTFVNFNT